jgi:hypothetical protein
MTVCRTCPHDAASDHDDVGCRHCDCDAALDVSAGVDFNGVFAASGPDPDPTFVDPDYWDLFCRGELDPDEADELVERMTAGAVVGPYAYLMTEHREGGWDALARASVDGDDWPRSVVMGPASLLVMRAGLDIADEPAPSVELHEQSPDAPFSDLRRAITATFYGRLRILASMPVDDYNVTTP